MRTAAGALLLALAAPLAAQTDTVGVADPVVQPEQGLVARPRTDTGVVVLPPEEGAGMRMREARRGFPADAPASPLLAPDHWAVRAAARAEALGLADGWLPAQGAVPRAVVFAALRRAEAAASAGRPRYAALARGWVARFREEFAEYGDDLQGDALLVPVNGRASAGWADEAGGLAPAEGYQNSRQDPLPLPSIRTPRAELALATGDRRWASVLAVARWDEGGFDLPRWEAAFSAGPVGVSFGRQPVAYGWSEGGGVVLSSTPMPRLEAQTLRPVHLPGFLRVFGGVALHLFASRTGGFRHPDEPWLAGARLAFQPHRRLSFAVNRGALFGGDEPLTARRLAGLLVGVIDNTTFENQVLSFEGRWRLPTDALLPATVYMEWGADDGAGALDEVPGRIVGLFLPALPGAPLVAAGAEFARFEAVCCGHGPWYFNYSFPGNWARGSRALGHPLGGEGWEGAGYARADLLEARLRVEVRGFARERWDDSYASLGGGNLFAPARTGRSTGFRAAAAYRFAPRAEVRAAARREAGDGWTDRGMDAQLSLFF
jgi:Capsule assembly protein Wzi